MTLSEYIERNKKIEEIADRYLFDKNCYDIRISSLPTNFTFVLRKDCVHKIEPNNDGELIIDLQISGYERVASTSAQTKDYYINYLKSEGKV